MATAEALRELYVLAPADQAYDEDALGVLLDTLGLNATLAKLWAARASQTATLVDVTESGSSRKMSAIHTQAKALADSYRKLAADEQAVTTPAVAYATTRPITR